MGFYGNITNTSKTSFTFDKIYPNRKQMDSLKDSDGVYAGRYVLVEYSATPDIPVLYRRVVEETPRFFRDPSFSVEVNENYLTALKNQYFPTSDLIVSVPLNHDYDDPNHSKYYTIIIIGSGDPVYESHLIDNFSDNDYLFNYNEDVQEYGPGRGYDSTVWQKTFLSDGTSKYVMIAELNSVVPTFGLSYDAPTAYPRVPYFDADSSNVFYRLHVQPTPGLWIKPAVPGHLSAGTGHDAAQKNYPSDLKCKYRGYTYSAQDEATADSPIYNILSNEISQGTPAAVYFNKAGFDKDEIHYASDVENGDTNHTQKNIWNYNTAEGKYEPENFISIDLNGKSGYRYNDPDSMSQSVQVDTNEIAVMLPSIGDTMAEVWNIIYGDEAANGGRERNTHFGWIDSGEIEEQPGLRLTQDAQGNIAYSPDRVKSIAGAINSTYDLMGMIIVDASEDGLSFDGTHANGELLPEDADDDKIYWDGEAYYRIGKEYTENNTSPNATNADAKFVNPYFKQVTLNEPEVNRYFEKYGDNYLLIRNANKFKKDKKYYTWEGTPSLKQSFVVADMPDSYQKDRYYYKQGDNYILDTNEKPSYGRQYYENQWESVAGGQDIIWFENNRFYKQGAGGQIVKDTSSNWMENTGSNYHYNLYLMNSDEVVDGGGESVDATYINVTSRVRKLHGDNNNVNYYAYNSSTKTYSLVTEDAFADVWTDDGSGSGSQVHTMSDISDIHIKAFTLTESVLKSLYTSGVYYYIANPITRSSDVSNAIDLGNNTYVIGDIILDKNPIRDTNKVYLRKVNDPVQTSTPFFVENEYYFQDDSNGTVTGDDLHKYKKVSSYVAGTYYERFDKHVLTDTNNIYPKYLKWNSNVAKPSAITLGWLEDKPVFKELEGYSKDHNTLNGLLLQTHELFGEEITRDTDTVRGAINTVNDLTESFATLKAGEIVVVDDYGRLHSAHLEASSDNWISPNIDSNQVSPTINFGHGNVGILPLTGYTALSGASSALVATDTVNGALAKLEKKIVETDSAASDAVAGLATVASTGDYGDLINTPNLATVATSGSYNDLSNKPTIPTTTSELTNDSNYVVSTSLASVATSGSYNDLSNKPTIPTAISDLTNDSSFVENTDIATGSNVGLVKPDGSTITVDSNGTISAIGTTPPIDDISYTYDSTNTYILSDIDNVEVALDYLLKKVVDLESRLAAIEPIGTITVDYSISNDYYPLYAQFGDGQQTATATFNYNVNTRTWEGTVPSVQTETGYVHSGWTGANLSNGAPSVAYAGNTISQLTAVATIEAQ